MRVNRRTFDRIWECLCDTFRCNEPFTLDQARRACIRPTRFSPGGKLSQVTYGSEKIVNARIEAVIDKVIAEGNDQIRRLEDGRFVLPLAPQEGG